MKNIEISTARFENKSSDQAYNLGIMESLSQKATAAGSQVIAFQ